SIILYNSSKINLIDYLGLHYWGSEGFQPFQLVTHMFMHSFIDLKDGSIAFSHIIFNMFGLFMFGSTLEGIWGGKRFLIFYMISGLLAAVVQLIITHFRLQSFYDQLTPEMIQYVYDNGYQLILEHKNYTDPIVGGFNGLLNSKMVGASGALYGILVGFGMLFPNSELMLIFIPVPVKAKYFIPGIIIVDLVLGVGNFSWDPIAHFAHLGGALAGFILIKMWQKDRGTFY
ncbi:MAG: rhomboid family intramembrane serine protease, partial [Vicingaceae bacterium]|nr:rhomboid family intramembrane serine protease [Vicingaceae bacterium]